MTLRNYTVEDFSSLVASNAPAPGGGSCAALLGALGAALTAMTAALTQGRKKYAAFEENAARVQAECEAVREALLALMQRDTEAFRTVSDAYAMPKQTQAQLDCRSAAIQRALRLCTGTPLEMMRCANQALELAASLSDGYNVSAASDLGVAFLAMGAALRGAWLNVRINLASISDEAFVREAAEQAQALLQQGLRLSEDGYTRVLRTIEG